MALSPVLPYTLPELQQLIYVKTNIGGWFFDAFLRLDHTSKLTITQHPVQTGVAPSDHAYLEPAELVIEIGMTDVAKSLVDGQFTGKWSRSVAAYEVLQNLQAQRIPLFVLTRLRIYKNMLIETISAPDDYKSLYGLRATVTMRELMVVQTATVKISDKPQVTDSTNRGNPEPVTPNQSILKQMEEKFHGSSGGNYGV